MLVSVSAAPVSGCGCFPVVVFVDGVFLRCELAVCVVFFYWFGDCVGVGWGWLGLGDSGGFRVGWIWMNLAEFGGFGFGWVWVWWVWWVWYLPDLLCFLWVDII